MDEPLPELSGLANQPGEPIAEHRTFTLSAKVHIAFKDFQDEPRYHAVLRRLKLEK